MVILKSSAEIDTMRAAGRIVFGALDELKKHVRPGISTWELDRIHLELSDLCHDDECRGSWSPGAVPPARAMTTISLTLE